jgi:hypothetical protein
MFWQPMSSTHAAEIAAKTRFEFGKNWTRFLGLLDNKRIRQAELSLQQMLGVESLQGKRFLVVALHTPYLVCARWIVRALTGRLQHDRGMSLWYDMIDWLGGYPFEVEKPAEIEALLTSQGFVLIQQKTCGRRMGCNEFVFARPQSP